MKNKKIKVAIVGVGNCAKALIEGVAYYKNNDTTQGLMHPEIGGYKVTDIEFVEGFDIDYRKINKPLYHAIYENPNCSKNLTTLKDRIILPNVNIRVSPAPIFDSMSSSMYDDNIDEYSRFAHYSDNSFEKESERINYVHKLIKVIKPDVIVNFLPVGSQKATEFWAEICLKYGISFVNCIPVFIASDEEWNRKFKESKVAIIGDDIKSQFGASILSQMLQELAKDRGIKTLCHIQRNVGGNTDFLNMMDKNRLISKKISKEGVINGSDFVYAGPSEYISYLKDNKIADIHIEMEGFAGSKMSLDCKLSVQDSPNSAGVVVDAIRFVKLAQERGVYGSLFGASALLCKHPNLNMPYDEAKDEVDHFLNRWE